MKQNSKHYGKIIQVIVDNQYDFVIFSRIWKDERQLQEFVKNKHTCVPIGSAIFN
jgi:hypothetical protein